MSEIKPKMNLLLPGEYCNNCPYFKPTVKQDDIYAAGIRIETLRNVVCENENLCENIHDYLKKTFENEGKLKKRATIVCIIFQDHQIVRDVITKVIGVRLTSKGEWLCSNILEDGLFGERKM